MAKASRPPPRLHEYTKLRRELNENRELLREAMICVYREKLYAKEPSDRAFARKLWKRLEEHDKTQADIAAAASKLEETQTTLDLMRGSEK